jgi:hypothetical protein
MAVPMYPNFSALLYLHHQVLYFLSLGFDSWSLVYNFGFQEYGAFEGKNVSNGSNFIFTKFILVRTLLKLYLLFA